jgi:protein-tyrosine phosphatase
VDDGAESLETAIETLRSFRESGIVRVVTTPHLDARDVGTTRQGRIELAFRALEMAASERVPEVELELAYEIRIDDPEIDLSDPALGLSGGGAILVEFSRLALPAYSERMLEVVREQDWTPVLAHPERYAGVETSYETIARWRAMGVLMCVNVGSLFGEYGREPERVARRMLVDGLADLLGSDHHARPHRSTLLRRGYDLLVEEGDPRFAEAARLLTETNPRAVLEGEPIMPVPPLDFPSGWFDRVLRKLLGGSK